MVKSAYFHVPFCAQKCHYCAFFSRQPTAGEMLRFAQALAGEIRMHSGVPAPETLFFGGGTPSILSVSQWTVILEALAAVGWASPGEWTIECNPATVSAEKAALWREAGVNRISMGVQSFDDGLLERLGRIHTPAMVTESMRLLRAAGFDNINLDLMFAIPSQSMAIWERTLEEALALGSEHLACYEVIYEEDTPLFHQLQAGEVEEVDEDTACQMYERLVDVAGKAGFQRYEVANFARGPVDASSGLPSRACRHNVNYWRGGGYHALGPSAAGHVQGARTKNWSNTSIYCDLVEQGRRPVEWSERLSPLAKAGEIAAFGLRMPVGWRWAEFQEVTGFDLRQEWAADIAALVGCGHGEKDGEGFRLTSEGIRFADAAGARFLRPDDHGTVVERGEPTAVVAG